VVEDELALAAGEEDRIGGRNRATDLEHGQVSDIDGACPDDIPRNINRVDDIDVPKSATVPPVISAEFSVRVPVTSTLPFRRHWQW